LNQILILFAVLAIISRQQAGRKAMKSDLLKQEELDNKLKQAMFSHDYSQARLLVNEGADPNTASGWGSPFIYWCAKKGKTELIDLALEKGADVHAANRAGETALHKAAYVGKVEIIDHLIDRGANINQKTIHGATPLFVAVLRDQLEAVRQLLFRGADPAIPNASGVSAAEIARELGHAEIETLLTQK
jgi:ankyrin repeat protein